MYLSVGVTLGAVFLFVMSEADPDSRTDAKTWTLVGLPPAGLNP